MSIITQRVPHNAMLSKKVVTRLILITAFFYDPTDTPWNKCAYSHWFRCGWKSPL